MHKKKKVSVVLCRTKDMFCEDQREVKRSPREFQSQSLSCGGTNPSKSVSLDFYHRFTCYGHAVHLFES